MCTVTFSLRTTAQHHCTGAPDVRVADWRMNVFRAKKTACRAVGTMGAFSAFVKRRKASTQPQVQRAMDAASEARVHQELQQEQQQQDAEDGTGEDGAAQRNSGSQQGCADAGACTEEREEASTSNAVGVGLGRMPNKRHVRGAREGFLDLMAQGRGRVSRGILSEQGGWERRCDPGHLRANLSRHAMESNGNSIGMSWASAGTCRGRPLRPSTQGGSRPGGGDGALSGSSTPVRTRACADEAGLLRSSAPAVAWSSALSARNGVDVLPGPGVAAGTSLSAGMGGTAAVGMSVPLAAAAPRPRFAAVRAKEGRGAVGRGGSRAAWSMGMGMARSMKRSSGGAAERSPKTLEEAMQRETRLAQQYKEEVQHLSRPLHMLAMFAHRCNAKWVEARAWGAPHVHEVSNFGKDVKGGLSSVYREQAIEALRAGKVVFQVLSSGQNHSLDVWSTDPWDFIASVVPAKARALDSKIPGLSMGMRVLLALVTAVSAVAGPEAVAKLMVVLHVHDGQASAVYQDLMAHSHCGLQPEHVVVVTQQRCRGYSFDAEQRRFSQEPQSALKDAGPGFSMLQLCWESEAHWVNSKGQPIRIMTSALDYLIRRGASWMLTRHAQDLSTLHPDSTIDVDSLAYMLYLHDAQAANMAVDVEYVNISGTQGLGSIQGLVLGSKAPQPVPPTATKPPAFRQRPSRHHRRAGQLVLRLRGTEKTPATRRLIPAGLLTSPSVFHPSLLVAKEGEVYLHYGIFDLTSHPGARCVALHAEGSRPAAARRGSEDVEALISALCAQDAAGPFRRLVGSTAASAARAARKAQAPSGAMGLKRHEQDAQADIDAQKARRYTGQRIVFLVSDNPASQLALQFAQSIFKPGKDLVMFMTIVPNSLAIPAGNVLMRKYVDAARATCVEAVAEVKVKTEALIEQLGSYVEECNADLVIMGSMVLAGSGTSTCSAMGSISLCLMKTLSRPLLIIKANAKNANIVWDQDKLKAVVNVDHASRPVLKYMCTKFLTPLRNDQLFLARAGATDAHAQETGISRRLLENFAEIASSHRFAPIKKPLHGSFDADVPLIIETEKIHVMAIQAPSGRAPVTDNLVKLLRTTRCALLLYKGVDL
ncbi:hypothetical protein DUNSADRAFT_10944 [Dunaliella salina]|uniref:UspA domain-containing protein n=1 Tax=Dunaliella salina TaxID=3046 RepID=A0ABQ7GEG3_DUNSA|nr:hypothetical protein DUNSADRAFT_10944 [Dunaliella salina]|eukprot:KAF5832988.1 hypothetical protein DUNSADRAFT_10944 [Dunaliella salina]